MKSDRIDLRCRVDQKITWQDRSAELGLTLTEMIVRAIDAFLIAAEKKSKVKK